MQEREKKKKKKLKRILDCKIGSWPNIPSSDFSGPDKTKKKTKKTSVTTPSHTLYERKRVQQELPTIILSDTCTIN